MKQELVVIYWRYFCRLRKTQWIPQPEISAPSFERWKFSWSVTSVKWVHQPHRLV